jgi:hypothetical protein
MVARRYDTDARIEGRQHRFGKASAAHLSSFSAHTEAEDDLIGHLGSARRRLGGRWLESRPGNRATASRDSPSCAACALTSGHPPVECVRHPRPPAPPADVDHFLGPGPRDVSSPLPEPEGHSYIKRSARPT